LDNFDAITLSKEELDFLKETFYAQSIEMGERLTEEVLALEANGFSKDSLKSIKRLFHTLKGDSSTIGLKDVAEIIHLAEDLLGGIEDGTAGIDDGIVDTILGVVDEIMRAIQSDRNGTSYVISEALKKDLDRRTRLADKPAVDIVAEMFGKKTTKPVAEGSLPQDSAEAAQKKDGAQTIRVRSERIDQMMDLVGELVLGRSMIEQLVKNFESRHPEDELVQGFLKANTYIKRSVSDLQRSVMSVRMVPFEKVFKKFPRMVRDICKANGREINLVLKGEETEVDKALIDVIGEPLLHIIRNAADHGIEPPAERVAAGKNSQGTISITACHRDSGVVITIEDDGKGIDPAELKGKAVQKGLIKTTDAEKMNEKDALGLIFLPGFSTAKTVSDISGRGIGMDIVKSVIENMRGTISVTSQAGKGTSVTLKFPMTLSIIRGVVVKISGKLYAVPMGSVVEIIRTYRKNLSLVAGCEVLRNRDRVVPIMRLRGHKESPRKDGKIFALILNHGDRTAALAVDGFLGEKELVVKAIDGAWMRSGTVSGASILGDGSVVLILNTSTVMNGAQTDEETRYGRAAN
jgi:two-component system, chemotaxis family, sensor kinase CheA